MATSHFHRKSSRRQRIRNSRPFVENLEDRLVPAALLPDLQVLASYLPAPYSTVPVTTTSSGGRQISYSTAMANAGQGAFELRGQPIYQTGTDGVQRQLVNQRVYQSDGTF